MAVKVSTFSGVREYPHAHSWYAGDDKCLQVYQQVGDNNEFIIAEFAEGSWEWAEVDPIPTPPQPEESDATEGERYDENDEEEDK